MNHLGNTNKKVGENVSNEQMTAHATPNEELRRQILSHVVPKNEREWWAARAIERLEFELNAANQRIKRLEEMYEGVIGEQPELLGSNVMGLLKRELNDTQRRIKRLEEAGDALANHHLLVVTTYDKAKTHVSDWNKAKEAKP